MSFSTELKEELSKTENLSNKEAVKYELKGYLISSNITKEKNTVRRKDKNFWQCFYYRIANKKTAVNKSLQLFFRVGLFLNKNSQQLVGESNPCFRRERAAS